MRTRSKQIFIFLLATAFCYLIFSTIALLWSINISLQIKDRSEATLTALDAGNYETVLGDLVRFEGQLSSAKFWQKFSLWMRYLPVIGTNYRAYDELLIAGKQISSSMNAIVRNLTQSSISTSFSFETFDLHSAPAAYLEVHDDIMEAFDHLIAANTYLADLQVAYLPESIQAAIGSLKARLEPSVQLITEYRPLLELAPQLLGGGGSHDLLFLLQNPHELRPTGGFIGTFGKVSLEKGIVNEFYTDDIYNLDINVLGKEEFEPPIPIATYTNVPYWYLRDANWSPDFPTSADLIKQMYRIESLGDEVDTIVAVTPYPIERFLALTGPIEVDGITFDHTNLIDALQYRVEQEFWRIGISDEERKSVINHLAQALRQRLFNLRGDDLREVVYLIQESLARKNILMNSDIPELQEYINFENWDGAVDQRKSDFIYVVDANLGALKTDRLVKRERNYRLRQNEDGSYVARLEIRYKNNGHFDYRTTRYRTYTRIYVPIGSTLLSSSGFVIEDKSTDYIEPMQYAEFDKTVFAGFLSIEPGDERFAVIEYRLPEWLEKQISSKQSYELFVQKQPGVDDAVFRADISLSDQLFSFSPSDVDYTLLNPNSIQFTDISTHDNEYIIDLKSE